MQQEHQQLFNSSVLEQQALIPEIYGSVDFTQLPERYVRDFDLESLRPSRHRNYCERVLENPELVERIRNYTMICLLYTSPSPRDKRQSRMPSSA